MPRASASLLLALCSTLGCTDAGDASPPARPSAAAPAPVIDPPELFLKPAPETPEPLEALALRCDGSAIAIRLASLDRAAIAALADPRAPPSTRLLATWETKRSFTAARTLEPAALTALLELLTAELKRAPPAWWTAQLASATMHAPDGAGLASYDSGLVPGTSMDRGDRRGPWLPGPGTIQVRPDAAALLSAADGKLFADLSMARVELGPLPTKDHTSLELARGRAGSTIYYASFNRGVGGFRFPLHAIASDGRPLWRAEVCGPDRQLLGGLGHLIVEIVALEPPPEPGHAPGAMVPSPGVTGIAVFTAETHGVALDVFDPTTGARVLAWSSELWFARQPR